MRFKSHNINWTHVYIICMPIACALAISVVIGYMCHGSVTFDPAKLINDMIAFMAGIISMIISFWYSQRFWRERLESEFSIRLKRQLLYYLGLIAKKIYESNQLLDKKYSGDQIDASQQRDTEVIANCRRIGDSKEHVLRIMDIFSRELLSIDEVREAMERFRSEIAPAIQEQIADCPSVRPNAAHLSEALIEYGYKIDDLIKIVSNSLRS